MNTQEGKSLGSFSSAVIHMCKQNASLGGKRNQIVKEYELSRYLSYRENLHIKR